MYRVSINRMETEVEQVLKGFYFNCRNAAVILGKMLQMWYFIANRDVIYKNTHAYVLAY